MSSLAVSRRLRRLQGPGGRVFLLAADHGLPAGPLPGIEDPRVAFDILARPPVTGVVLHAGLVRFVPAESQVALVVHLSAGTLLSTSPTSKVIATSVARALTLGADAVSVQIHFGDPEEPRMLRDVGVVIEEADRFGLPVLVMAYPPRAAEGDAELEATRHAARAAAELGADLVQVPHPGDPRRLGDVVRGCPVPLLVAGGPRAPAPDGFLDAVRTSLAEGAAGVTVGRNLFQHPNPARFAGDIGRILFGPGAAVETVDA